MKVNSYDKTGKLRGQTDLPADVFDAAFSKTAIHTVIRAENANRRQGTHKVKVRNEVRGGGKKPWKQKGTGNARQGSIRAPQWRGGGTVHGPQPRSYRIDLPARVRKAGIRAILASKAKAASVAVLEDPSVTEYSTKTVFSVLSNIGVSAERSVVIIINTDDEKFLKSADNISNLRLVHAKRITAPEVYYANSVLVTESALKVIAEQYKKESRKGKVA
jgi:large subunit ribosomal protein L4